MASKRKSATPPGGRWGAAPVERLRAICLALPETTEKLAWGEPTWRVGGRLFAQLDDHHHGADHLAVWLPAPLGEQEAMVFTDPERFFRPPYVGVRGWVGVRMDERTDWALMATLVAQAYRQVAPPRLRGAAGTRAPAAAEAVTPTPAPRRPRARTGRRASPRGDRRREGSAS